MNKQRYVVAAAAANAVATPPHTHTYTLCVRMCGRTMQTFALQHTHTAFRDFVMTKNRLI